MNLPHNKSVTLLELLIAITLISLIALGFSSIDLFSRYHVLTSDRRARLQNEVSHALEHMTKQISRAIGNERIFGVDTVVEDEVTNIISIYVDQNQNGIRDTTAGTDRWIAYRFYPLTAPPANRFQVRYCPQCNNSTCNSCTPAWSNVDNILGRQISNFTFDKPEANDFLTDNSITVTITACWDPDGTPQACGNPDNPSVTMSTRIKMPAVSTN